MKYKIIIMYILIIILIYIFDNLKKINDNQVYILKNIKKNNENENKNKNKLCNKVHNNDEHINSHKYLYKYDDYTELGYLIGDNGMILILMGKKIWRNMYDFYALWLDRDKYMLKIPIKEYLIKDFYWVPDEIIIEDIYPGKYKYKQHNYNYIKKYIL